MVAPILALALALAATPPPLGAQQSDLRREILESQRRLEQIRAERARLQAEMEGVQVRVRDAAADLANVERRLSASRSVLAEIQLQSDATSEEIATTSLDLVQARERLAAGKAVLNRRLRDIYKLGPLQTVRVLLGATSFTDLLNRYRYLQRVASFDRALVDRVNELEQVLSEQSDELEQRMAELSGLRQARQGEVAQLRSVEEERQATLQEYRSRQENTETQLGQLEADEKRMTGLIDDLERRRIEEERRRSSASAGEGTLSASDEGSLDWPLDGDILYHFGRERRPNGLVLRWNGIGIEAAPGNARARRARRPRGVGRALRGIRAHGGAQPRKRLLHPLPLPGGHRGRGGA